MMEELLRLLEVARGVCVYEYAPGLPPALREEIMSLARAVERAEAALRDERPALGRAV